MEKPTDKYVPIVGELLVVALPSERIRGEVMVVPDEDTAIVKLVTAPFAKTHRYGKGDLVPVRRKQTPLEEIWEAIDERQLAMAENVERFERARADEARVMEEALANQDTIEE
jgi:hypothetical protein